MAGRQCLKRLWLLCHDPDKATPPGPLIQFLFDQGRAVDRAARRLYPEGVAVAAGRGELGVAISRTRELVNKSVPAIFEAAFSHKNVVVRADILRKSGEDTWQLTEIKSSTKVKPEHIPDVAIQYWVISGAGLKIDRCSLLYVNKRFIHGEPIEKFYCERDLTKRVGRFIKTLENELPEFMELLRRAEAPLNDMGPFCKAPHLCEFFSYCKLSSPANPVMQLPRIGKKYDRLMARGIRQISEIPEEFELTPLQSRVRDCVREGRDFRGPKLGEKLRNVIFPVHYLDMETVGTAFPLYPGTRPYQAIPFQYSLHIKPAAHAQPVHRQYLHRGSGNPMPDLARRLLDDIGESGTICAYTGYEQRQIETLAAAVPECAEQLRALIPRILDLADVIRSEYYHPGFAGSFSIKAVAPALLGDIDYDRLDIGSGGEASVKYLQLIDPETPGPLKNQLARSLEEYCRHDTLALIGIHHVLLGKSKSSTEGPSD